LLFVKQGALTRYVLVKQSGPAPTETVEEEAR
jgi:hypothetical protein